MNMKLFPFFIAFIASISTAFAQQEQLYENEQKLVVLLDTLRKAEGDAAKKIANSNFKMLLKSTLELEEAYSYPFSELKSVGFINSPDGMVRIINWNVEQADQTQVYHCFILNNTDKKKGVQLVELVDNSFMLPEQPEDILAQTDWYGALYYKIIPVKKGSKTIYTLLGWDGATAASNKKLIDALYFVGNQAKLGSPIFKLKDKTLKRVYFEHSETATMSLKYDDQYKRIIFDHLSPEAPGLEGFYSFYVPDMSYDAMYYDDGKWVLKEDVISVNPVAAEKTHTIRVMNKKTGLPEEKEVKQGWINPEDSKDPTGGYKHTAMTPEDQLNDEKNKDPKNEIPNVKDKRDPSQMSSVLGTKKKRRK
ncbi:MAG: hypothetical protein V4638_06270 [Bacteroidota bacterium]